MNKLQIFNHLNSSRPRGLMQWRQGKLYVLSFKSKEFLPWNEVKELIYPCKAYIRKNHGTDEHPIFESDGYQAFLYLKNEHNYLLVNNVFTP